MESEDKSISTILRIVHGEINLGDKNILKDINLEIKKNDFYYLIGKVGSGKTSLLRAIYADIPIKAEQAFAAGFDLLKLKTKQIPLLRRKLGIVFQDFQLLTDRTVYQNLYFTLKATGWKNQREMDRRIYSVLDKVEMKDKINQMPHTLSGGEQQRVVIARALLNDPEVILADEPTGNLDPKSGAQIIEILRKIRDNGRAILMVTHNYSLIKEFPEQTLICDNGRITGEGTEVSGIDFGKFSDGSEDLKLFK